MSDYNFKKPIEMNTLKYILLSFLLQNLRHRFCRAKTTSKGRLYTNRHIIRFFSILLGLMGVWYLFSKSKQDPEEYFLGSRRFSGWVLGLSMRGTIVSSATFLALPAAGPYIYWTGARLTIRLSGTFCCRTCRFDIYPFFSSWNSLLLLLNILGRKICKVP